VASIRVALFTTHNQPVYIFNALSTLFELCTPFDNVFLTRRTHRSQHYTIGQGVSERNTPGRTANYFKERSRKVPAAVSRLEESCLQPASSINAQWINFVTMVRAN
jgi:hypothetical protein